MNSIENILKYIKDLTSKEIQEIKNKNLIECNKITKNTKLILENEDKLTQNKIAEKKEELQNEFDVEMQQLRKKLLSCKKEEIITKTIELACKTLCEEKKDLYIKFIKNLLTKNIPLEDCRIIFAKKDYDNFKSELENHLKTNNRFKLQLEYCETFDHGFKIISEKYILNFDVKSIFSENIIKLKEKTYNALNLEENSHWNKI